MAPRKLTDELKAKLLEAYRDGATGHAVCKQFGVSPASFYRVVQEAGLSRGRGHREPTVNDGEIAAAYKECLSAYKVAERFGVSNQTVYRALVRAGVAAEGLDHYRRNAERYPRETQLEIMRRYEAGERAPALLKQFGGSVESIRQAILRNGGKMKKPPGKPADITEAEVKDICDRYRAGMSSVALAQLIGHSQPIICHVLKNNGVPLRRRRRSGERGRYISDQGYVWVRIPANDPMIGMVTSAKRMVQEHRLVMARHLERPLLPTETVHHLNGDRGDNRVENLQLRQGKHGKGVAMCCLDCGSRNVGPAPIGDEKDARGIVSRPVPPCDAPRG